MNRKLVPLLILSLTFLNGCGGGGSSTGGGGGGGPQAIAVTFQALPPSSMMTGDNVGVSATVTNDSKNGGVSWTCMPAGACGTFNPTATASGANTTYVAPGSVPAGGTVTLIATSATDTTKNAQAQVSVTAPPPAITVFISTAPAATLPVSGTTTVAATTNDTAGVTWSCTPAGSCGLFNPTSTTSTTPTTYTAPASVPAGGTVIVTARSVTDTTKSASAPVLVTGVASNASLQGQYAFIVSAPTGNPVSRGITTWIGSIAFDGAGNVPALPSTNPPSGGLEDIVSPQYHDEADPILATVAGQTPTTHYSVDPSGHGTLLMLTQHGETLNMSFVVTSPSHAVVIELDGEPGSGTLDLQTPPAGGFAASQISGGYSFTMVGVDAVSTPSPYLSFGGTFSFSTANNITGLTGGVIDINTAGLMSSSAPIMGGQVDTAPDSITGRGVFHIVVPFPGTSRTFIFYMVSPKVLRFTEQDAAAFMGGSAYAQGSAGTTLSGPYVYQHSGWNPAVANPPTGRTVAAGQFSVASGSSTFSGGLSDANTGAIPPTTGSPGLAISGGSYSIPATLNGTLAFTDAAGVASTFNMYMVDPTLNILDPNNTTGGGGALLLHTDTHINGTGILVPQQTATAFLGIYALNLNNSIATATPNELDLIGVLSGDGNGHFGGAANFALADYDQVNSSPTPVLGAPLSGGFQMDQGHPGRATGSFTVNLPAGAVSPNNYPFIPGATPPVTLGVAIYQVNNAESFIVETDTAANVSGYLVRQQLP